MSASANKSQQLNNMSASANTSQQLKYVSISHQHKLAIEIYMSASANLSQQLNESPHIFPKIIPLGHNGVKQWFVQKVWLFRIFYRCHKKRGFGILGQQNSHFLTFLASRKYETDKHRLNDQSDHNWWQPLWFKFYTSWTPSHRLVQIVEKIFELHLISRWWAPAPPHSLASQLLTHWQVNSNWNHSTASPPPSPRPLHFVQISV